MDSAVLVLGALGCIAAVGVHAAGWLGVPVVFEATFLLLAGCMLVWWRALTASRRAFGNQRAGSLWKSVKSRCPRWVGVSFQPLTYYAAAYWVYVTYLQVVRHENADSATWARFDSAFAFIFYFYGVAFLRAAISVGRSASGTQS
jgi:hypothetical protein